MNRQLKLAAIALAAAALSGCGHGKFDDLKQWMAQDKKTMHPHIEPLPDVKPYEPLVYNAFDLLDPFNPAKLEVQRQASGNALRPDANRPRDPLEAYDLEKLRMVGTLQDGKEIDALIHAPDGNVYRIKVGNYMGQNFGKVTAITEQKLTLKEIVEDSSGDWVERNTKLSLGETEKK